MPYSKKRNDRRERVNENARKWRANNKDKEKNNWLIRIYGITLKQYNEMYIKQDGVCAICKNPETIVGRSLCVDHDHVDGRVRGLLCLECNSGIGHLKDNIKYLSNAITYLKNEEFAGVV